MSMTTAQGKAFLLGLLPRGFASWFDFSAGSFGDQVLEAAAEQFALRVATNTDAVEANSNPWTLLASGLADWESALGLVPSFGATTAQRQAAIIARFREFGAASCIPAIQSILAPLLGYATATQLQIVEMSRSSLTAAHTYANASGFSGFGLSVTQTVTVADQGTVSDAGPQVTFAGASFNAPTVTLTSPDGHVATWSGGAGAGQGLFPAVSAFTLCAPSLAGVQVGGTWTLQVADAVFGSATSWSLFVEGVGPATTGASPPPEGLGASIFEWSVLVDPTLAGVTAPADFARARAAIQRIEPAHTTGYLVQKMSGGSSVAIYDDANALENGCLYA
jgi:hypothetical protein